MSKSLSVATILEKNRIESGVPFLPLLDIEVVDPATGSVVETLHLVRNDELIVFNGIEYVPCAFDISMKEEVNTQTSLELSINDYSQALQAQMQAYQGGVGFNVVFTIVDSSALDLPPELVEYFEVMSASASEYTASFGLGANNNLFTYFPRRRQTRDYCQWRFKDPDTCGYAGSATSCDFTLQGPNGCAAKGKRPDGRPQTIQFGAYPGINSNGIRYA
ncbi:hypothetical protein GFK26_18545 [Variovorax paradoxus]|uniref:Phage minor tail protein L n=1 Tax=Variovorax paradoxus TaxID=34073 RepID=A0A5Q0M738_VARPD|nr:hypothetical protein [Variovorax paradoxus]QFZ84627.1 hypothetical protein GFK26_18545 [Variovorax paradoxus]